MRLTNRWPGADRPTALFAEPSNRLARKIDPDTLHLRVKLQGLFTHFPAVTRLLVATKGRSSIEHVEGIDPHHAGLYLLRKTMSPRDVPRPNAGSQAIDCLVGLLDQVIFVFEGNHGNDRAKNLLLSNTHLVLDFAENGWLKEIAVLEGSIELRGRA